MRLRYSKKLLIEAGCDEAGRGCLAGPVVAAAVVLPDDFKIGKLRDSKKLSEKLRNQLRKRIEKEALYYSVQAVDHITIDEINILNASFLAMHKSVGALEVKPDLLLIDGNRFNPYPFISHTCIIKGDDKFAAIAAASVLAKTHRDELMIKHHDRWPNYSWNTNKGYPTKAHRAAIAQHGITEIHRRSFKLL